MCNASAHGRSVAWRVTCYASVHDVSMPHPTPPPCSRLIRRLKHCTYEKYGDIKIQHTLTGRRINRLPHRTMQWCRARVRDAFPWEVVQTHKVQVFTLHTFVFTIRSCCWQDCLWICGKQPAWTHTHAIIVDYTFLLVVYGLVIVMTTSYAHCHTIVHIQSYSHTHTTMQRCCTQVNESGPWKELYTYNVQVLTVST